MGALCSACLARRGGPLSKERSLAGAPESMGLLPPGAECPGGPGAGALGPGGPAGGATGLLQGSKSETFALLGAAGGAGTTGSLRSEQKRSLTAKWSGTLNRTSSESKSYSEAKIITLFEKYKDSAEDSILSEGIEEFCIDLQLKPDEFRVLVLAWKFEAEQMCRFTRTEFLTGCRALRADSCRSLQARLPDVAAGLVTDPDKFRDLYRFTYKFGLDSASGQRILPVDMAISLWLLVYSQDEPPLLKKWVHFLEKHPQVRGIPRDTWNMFLNFTTVVGSNLSQYDDTEAWPSLFDDFVEFENDQLNQNSSTMQDLNLESSSPHPL